MFKRLVPVNKQNHKGWKIKRLENFHFAGNIHIASLVAHEFGRAAGSMPIVFLEDKENDMYRPVSLLGFEEGENLFVNKDSGQWEPGYIPAIIRRYPFSLSRSNEEGVFNILVDEDCGLLSQTEGDPLFKDDGELAELMENVQRYLGELHQMNEFTNKFCSYLKQQGLFVPLQIRIPHGGGARDITGCFRVDEDKLNELPDAVFLEMRNQRYLSVIYAHLISLQQVDRLIRLRQARYPEEAQAARQAQAPAGPGAPESQANAGTPANDPTAGDAAAADPAADQAAANDPAPEGNGGADAEGGFDPTEGPRGG